MEVVANPRAMEVLLVDDSPGVVRLTKEVFRNANGAVNLHIATDGAEAMAFLRREGAKANAPRPDLILLDLHLPKMSGHEVLALIKADGNFRSIPTVILTASTDEADIKRSYELNANSHLNKPVELEAFEVMVKSINDFWLTKASSQTTLH